MGLFVVNMLRNREAGETIERPASPFAQSASTPFASLLAGASSKMQKTMLANPGKALTTVKPVYAAERPAPAERTEAKPVSTRREDTSVKRQETTQQKSSTEGADTAPAEKAQAPTEQSDATATTDTAATNGGETAAPSNDATGDAATATATDTGVAQEQAPVVVAGNTAATQPTAPVGGDNKTTTADAATTADAGDAQSHTTGDQNARTASATASGKDAANTAGGETATPTDAEGPAFDDIVAAATQSTSGKKSASTSNNAQPASAEAGRQAAELAQSVGQGDTVSIQVKKSGAGPAIPSQTAAVANAALVEDSFGQSIDVAQQATEQGVQTQPQTAGTKPATGIANAAAQVAANAAMQNATEAQGKAAAATPFAAALAAQAEASATPGPAAAQPQTGNVTAIGQVGGTSATAATQQAAATQAARSPQAPQHVRAQDVIDQVTVQIDKAAKEGADTISIQLKPASLGKIEVRLEMSSDGRVTAMVTAENKDTLQLLQRDAQGLEKALQDAGLKTEAGGLNFGLRGQEHQNSAQDGRAKSGRGRRGESEDAIETVAVQPQVTNSSGAASGVDIRV